MHCNAMVEIFSEFEYCYSPIFFVLSHGCIWNSEQENLLKDFATEKYGATRKEEEVNKGETCSYIAMHWTNKQIIKKKWRRNMQLHFGLEFSPIFRSQNVVFGPIWHSESSLRRIIFIMQLHFWLNFPLHWPLPFSPICCFKIPIFLVFGSI